MSTRLLVVPAAGLGTRLGGQQPKLLVPVAGVPMIDRLLTLFRPFVDRAVIVVHPSFEADVRRHLGDATPPVTCLVQSQPTGMLDAIMLAEPIVKAQQPDEVWIAWCDQVAIHPATLARLSTLTGTHRDAALVMPTVHRQDPYIHLRRDQAQGRIVEILHRREGDVMPAVGESDMGVFAVSREAFLRLLPQYVHEVTIGAATGERNFLPFISWVNKSHGVVTFPSVDQMEATGVNTPEELRAVERYLETRESTSA